MSMLHAPPTRPVLQPAGLRLLFPRRPPSLRSGYRHHRRSLAARAEGNTPGGETEPLAPPPPASGAQLLALSTVTYAGMTAAAVWAGDATGSVHIPDLLAPAEWHPGAALLWTAALLPYPFLSAKLADTVASFGELRELFKQAIVPTLEQLPVWGIGLLALGAGVGEETFFRGFLQTAAVSSLAGVGGGGLVLPEPAATWVGVGSVSLLFGVLHAATPLYFYFATVAGVLFGIEYLTAGLPAAAATHFLYDFVALVFIVREWGSGSNKPGSKTA